LLPLSRFWNFAKLRQWIRNRRLQLHAQGNIAVNRIHSQPREEIPIGRGLRRIGKHTEAQRMCARYKRRPVPRLLLLGWSEEVHFTANYTHLRGNARRQKLLR